jgi:lipoprotein-releasing system permease protein
VALSLASKLARKYLFARRGEAFVSIISVVSVLGVGIGVAVLCIVMSVMGGFEYELRSKVLGANSHILVRSLAPTIKDWEKSSSEIEAVSGVLSVSPYAYAQALVRTDRAASGVLLRGIRAEDAAGQQLTSYLREGKSAGEVLVPPQGSDPGQGLSPIVVGAELARTLSLFPGAIVTVMSPSVTSSPFGLIPRTKRFVVTAVYRSGLTEYEAAIAYIRLSDAQSFFQMDGGVTGLEVRLKEVQKAKVISDQIFEKLGGAESGLFVQPWTETNQQLWEAIQLEKRVYFLVLLLIVIMASFSIITTLIMIVLEKRRDIATLMMMGASPAFVSRVFRAQGTIIGATGVVLGLVLGAAGCWGLKAYGFPLNEKVFQMATVPVRAEPMNFVVVGLVAFAICYLATLYPSWRASRIHPAELLRA